MLLYFFLVELAIKVNFLLTIARATCKFKGKPLASDAEEHYFDVLIS